jgi:hypothetical protein
MMSTNAQVMMAALQGAMLDRKGFVALSELYFLGFKDLICFPPHLTLRGQGGWPAFVVQKATDLTPGAPWEVVMPPAAVTNLTVPMNTPNGSYRMVSHCANR